MNKYMHRLGSAQAKVCEVEKPPNIPGVFETRQILASILSNIPYLSAFAYVGYH